MQQIYPLHPALPSDKSLCRARLAPHLFTPTQLTINQWCKIITKKAVFYCKAWPFLKPQKPHVQADTKVSRLPTSDESKGLVNENDCKVMALSLKLPNANRIKVELCDPSIIDKIPLIFIENSIKTQLVGLAISHSCTIEISVKFTTINIKVVDADSSSKNYIISPSTEIILNTVNDPFSMQELGDALITLPPGLETAHASLHQLVIYPLLYSRLLDKLNIQAPRGILLHGVPGVGKTMLVRNLAQELRVGLVVIQGPDYFGADGDERLRKKFLDAEKEADKKGCILFIDEIDALTPTRRRNMSNHAARITSSLLLQIDNIQSPKLVVIGATNRPNAIDPSLRRPGRLEREVCVDIPTLETRIEILKYLCVDMKVDSDVDFNALGELCNGYVGADLKSLCRETVFSSTDGKITMQDFHQSFSKITPSLRRHPLTITQAKGNKLSWDDIGGLESVKLSLTQMVEWPLKHIDVFKRLGINAPKGILLYGPPGCSKTSLIRTIASTCAGVTFLSLNGASVYSPYLGESERTIRETFTRARSTSPSIIFFDELDAIVGKRNLESSSGGGGTSVQERVLSTLLNEMDGVEGSRGVLVVGATNRPDMIDAALLRPGRFDKLLYVPPPDQLTRYEILRIHTQKTPLDKDVDLEKLSGDEYTKGFTGADLKGLVRESCMEALREGVDAGVVRWRHFAKGLEGVRPSLTGEFEFEF